MNNKHVKEFIAKLTQNEYKEICEKIKKVGFKLALPHSMKNL